MTYMIGQIRDESGPKPVFMGREDCDADVEKFVKSLPEIIAAKVTLQKLTRCVSR